MSERRDNNSNDRAVPGGGDDGGRTSSRDVKKNIFQGFIASESQNQTSNSNVPGVSWTNDNDPSKSDAFSKSRLPKIDHTLPKAEDPSDTDDAIQGIISKYISASRDQRSPLTAVDVVMSTELLPRLLMAHRVRSSPDSNDNPIRKTTIAISQADREFFKALVLEEAEGSPTDFIKSLIARGVSPDDVVFDLFGDTARELGVLWEKDELDFATVTIGLCNLHRVMRNHDWPGVPDPGVSDKAQIGQQSSKSVTATGRVRPTRKVMLTTLNNDQHIFGLYAVAEAFRREGWSALTAAGAERLAVAAMLADEHFDILAVSASCDFDVSTAADELSGYRAAAKNKDLKIIVGGPAFGKDCEAVYNVGADGWSRDARDAPAAAGALLDDLIKRF